MLPCNHYKGCRISVCLYISIGLSSSGGLYLIVVLGRLVPVRRSECFQTPEGREGGRAHAASQRNVLLGSFRTHMTISTTPLASQQNLIWQLSAMRSPIRRSIPASGHQTLTVLPGPREHSYSRSRISQLPGIKTFPILPFLLLAFTPG